MDEWSRLDLGDRRALERERSVLQAPIASKANSSVFRFVCASQREKAVPWLSAFGQTTKC
jgi:hypothetical protein